MNTKKSNQTNSGYKFNIANVTAFRKNSGYYYTGTNKDRVLDIIGDLSVYYGKMISDVISINEIVKDYPISKVTLKKTIKELIDEGLIIKQIVSKEDGGRLGTRYGLNFKHKANIDNFTGKPMIYWKKKQDKDKENNEILEGDKNECN